MATQHDLVLGQLRELVEKNRGVYPVTDPFPYTELDRLACSAGLLPAEATPILSELLEMTGKYDDAVDHRGRNAYDGADLRRDALVVRALRRCPPSAEVVPTIAAMLEGSTQDRYYAEPGGSPDADKYDRDSSVEAAQDHLAHQCALLLESLPLDAAAKAALDGARKHRSDEVRTAAAAALVRGRPR